jgi:hypothetical protein
LVGTLELAHTGRRGSPDSLGPLPLDFVTATLTYRVVVGDDTSLRTVLVSNQISVKGAGSNPAHAVDNAIREMVDTAVDPLVTQMLQRIRARAPKIRVHVNGVNSSASDRTIRQTISAIPWVAGVETSRFGEYIVEYPERVAYLAASISQLPGFRVVDFSPISVLVRFEGSP